MPLPAKNVHELAMARMTAARTRVLCVEPSVGMRRVLRHVLERHFDLEFASTAAEATLRLNGGLPIHAVLAARQLDDASGVDLLGAVSRTRPDVTRILLSSARSVALADDLVAGAGLYRVLTMPTSEAVLLSAIRDGVQASLQARRDEQSHREHLRSALSAAASTLTTATPALGGRAERVARHIRDLAAAVAHAHPERLELAAMACEVGLIDATPAIVAKIQSGSDLSPTERARVGAIAPLADAWLATLPGTESVRGIVGATLAAEHGGTRLLPRDAGIVRLCRQFDQLINAGYDAREALSTMSAPTAGHDAELLSAFTALRAPAAPIEDFALVNVDAIEVGMVFAHDVMNSDGVLLVPRGHAVTAVLRDRMRTVWSTMLHAREFRMYLRAPDDSAPRRVSETASDIQDEAADDGVTGRYAAPTAAPVRAMHFADSDPTLRVLGLAMASANDGIMITDAELDAPGPRIVFVNAAFERMTGWSAEELLTRTPRVLQGPETDRNTMLRLRDALSRGEPFQGSTVNYRRDGAPFIMEWSISAVTASDGRIQYFVAVQRDITAFRRRLADAEESARTDALTGLANRRAYENRLAALVARPDAALGLLAIDIDRFKSINDTYGHGAGDDVLVEVGRRMKSIAAEMPHALLARTGGEEFSFLAPSPDASGGVGMIGEAMRAAVSASPIMTGATPLTITISVGAATARPPRLAADILTVSADRALYRAKSGGRDRVEIAIEEIMAA